MPTVEICHHGKVYTINIFFSNRMEIKVIRGCIKFFTNTAA